MLPIALALLQLAGLCAAQFVDQDATLRNLTVVRSPINKDLVVSYKEPQGACATAFKTQKQYTGYVSVQGDYPTNLFFWFVEAREPTDSLTLWFNGGPGASSLYGFFTGNGPCEVVEKGLDKYETVAREWGWDRASHMLFIDQPNQVGLSFDTPTNGTMNFLNSSVTEPAVPGQDHYTAPLTLNGTFSSQNSNNTANTTQTAAIAVWDALQGFFSTFPQYGGSTPGSVAINLFAESYGGRYGPVFAETIQNQNQKRLTGELSRNTTIEIQLRSLGLINGCVDPGLEALNYPLFANDNTYGLKAISDEESRFYVAKANSPGGCLDLLEQCQLEAARNDPKGMVSVQSVNEICSRAGDACGDIQTPYYNFGRSAYDLSAPQADPFPSMMFQDYLNIASVQEAIGSPINYTMVNNMVNQVFSETGDMSRGGNIARLASLLNSGVKVGLLYGDRDYICNWYGGQAVSLAVAEQAGGEYAAAFAQAGYAPIIVNDSYIGGEVRQFGNLSFSRIYQAGHSVASYQPETAFQIFARVILGNSVSTGSPIDLADYNTTGETNSTHTEELPDAPKPTCFVHSLGNCDQDALNLLQNDEGVVINNIIYSSSQDWPLYSSSSTTETEAKPFTTEALTGAYTATATPKSENDAGSLVLGYSYSCIVFMASYFIMA